MELEYTNAFDSIECILPCVINVSTEDDVIIDFDVSSVSMVVLFSHFNANCIRSSILTLTNGIAVSYLFLLGTFTFGRKTTSYAR